MKRAGSKIRPFFSATLLLGLGGLTGSLGCTGEIGTSSGANTPPNQDPANPGNTGPGGSTVTPLTCKPSASPSVGVSPLRRLTRSQYNNSVRDLLGIDNSPAAEFALDEKVGPFFSNASAP